MFLRQLLKCLIRHLQSRTDFKVGKNSWDDHTVMKIKLTLSWVEGRRVLYMNRLRVLNLFRYYCSKWYPNYYQLRLAGYKNIIIN